MKKLNQNGFSAFEIVLLVLVVAALAFAGFVVYQRNRDERGSSPVVVTKKDSDTKEEKAAEEKELTPREKTEATIVSEMDKGNYMALEGVMAESVSYARQASDTGGSGTKTEAAKHLDSFLKEPNVKGNAPWNFNVMKTDASFAAKIESMDSAYAGGFPYNDNAFIGRSSEGDIFIAFQFNEQGLIKSFWYGFTSTL